MLHAPLRVQQAHRAALLPEALQHQDWVSHLGVLRCRCCLLACSQGRTTPRCDQHETAVQHGSTHTWLSPCSRAVKRCPFGEGRRQLLHQKDGTEL